MVTMTRLKLWCIKHFHLILEYLNDVDASRLPLLIYNDEEVKWLLREADRYGLDDLVVACNQYLGAVDAEPSELAMDIRSMKTQMDSLTNYIQTNQRNQLDSLVSIQSNQTTHFNDCTDKLKKDKIYDYLNGGKNFSNLIFNGLNISKISFKDCNFFCAVMERVNLQGADFRNSYMFKANLKSSNLRNCYLNGANLRYADLSDCDLQGCILDGADLTGAKLVNAKLKGARLDKAKLIDADLSGCDLQDSTLIDVDLTGAKLVNANFKGARIRVNYKLVTRFVNVVKTIFNSIHILFFWWVLAVWVLSIEKASKK